MWDIAIKEKVYQRLANEIFFRILHGEYAPGSKLPSHIDLAKEAGSSPETVRKAIRELQRNGVVEKRGWVILSLQIMRPLQLFDNNILRLLKKNILQHKER